MVGRYCATGLGACGGASSRAVPARPPGTLSCSVNQVDPALVRGASVPSKSFEVSRGNSTGGAAVRAAECVGWKWAARWGPATTQWRAGAFVPRHRRARRTRLRHQEPYRRDPHGPTSSRRSRNQLIQLTLPGVEEYILLVWRYSLQPSLPTDSRVRPRHSRLPHTRQHLPLPPPGSRRGPLLSWFAGRSRRWHALRRPRPPPCPICRRCRGCGHLLPAD